MAWAWAWPPLAVAASHFRLPHHTTRLCSPCCEAQSSGTTPGSPSLSELPLSRAPAPRGTAPTPSARPTFARFFACAYVGRLLCHAWRLGAAHVNLDTLPPGCRHGPASQTQANFSPNKQVTRRGSLNRTACRYTLQAGRNTRLFLQALGAPLCSLCRRISIHLLLLFLRGKRR